MFYRSKQGHVQVLKEHSSNKDALSVISAWQGGVSNITVKTSGSTADPKIINLTREQITASVKNSAAHFNWSESDLFICNINANSIAGKMVLIRALEVKAAILYLPASAKPVELLTSQEEILKLYKHKLILALVPLQVTQAIDSQNTLAILNSSKTILIGGAPISAKLQSKLDQVTSPVFATYGMTETASHVAVKKLNSSNNAEPFKALPGVFIKSDERSCLKIKAPQTSNKWITTNDLVQLVNESEFIYIGRADNTINSGGVKIQLENIEKAIELAANEPGQFFAFALNDEVLGQALSIAFIPSNNSTKIFNKAFMKEVFPKFEVPRYYFPIDRFELTTSGKIDKIKTVNAHIRNQLSD